MPRSESTVRFLVREFKEEVGRYSWILPYDNWLKNTRSKRSIGESTGGLEKIVDIESATCCPYLKKSIWNVIKCGLKSSYSWTSIESPLSLGRRGSSLAGLESIRKIMNVALLRKTFSTVSTIGVSERAEQLYGCSGMLVRDS